MILGMEDHSVGVDTSKYLHLAVRASYMIVDHRIMEADAQISKSKKCWHSEASDELVA